MVGGDWNMIIFPIFARKIGNVNVIIPIDEVICFRGVQ